MAFNGGGFLRALALPTVLALAVIQGAAAAETGTVLVPHVAVYDLSLFSSTGGRGVAAVRGRIAYDFGGSACEGYSLSFRQVSVVESSEGGGRMSDLRSTTFEEGDGSAFRFRQETVGEAGVPSLVDGRAELRKPDGLIVNVSKPKAEKLTVDGAVAFPSAHMKRLIDAAKAGETTLAVRVFDGSDDGSKIYDTFSVIGKKVAAGSEEGLDEASRKAGLGKLARWPVSITYFTQGAGERTPVYSISFPLFENGVSGSLKLDYGEFAVKGELKSLDLKKVPDCGR